jgi:hypothetical protein
MLPAIGNDSIGFLLRDLVNRNSVAELPSSPPPLPPPPPPALVKADPIRVSAGAQQAELVHQVNPVLFKYTNHVSAGPTSSNVRRS